MIQIGQKAPNFTLPDSQGNQVSLHDFEGKKNVVLILYPGDDTPGCTQQLCAIRDDIAKFDEENAVVLGINHAGSDSHQAFIQKYGLRNPLLIDEQRKVITEYGAVGEYEGQPSTVRTVVIINKNGIVQYYTQGLPPDSELLEELHKINAEEQTVPTV